MSDNHAEQLDGDALGEEVGDDGIPGNKNFPPDQMLGVNDPNQVASDDVAMREARTRSEEVPPAERRTGDLLPPDGDDGQRDDVQQMVGSADGVDDDELPAEVAAIHTTDEI